MIELRNLTKSYPTRNGRRYVFRNLNFTLPSGEGVGLIGRNGAGKSTLLRLLGGIDAADSGEVVCTESISWPIGLSGGFQGSLTARDNIRFVCRIYGAEGPDMHDVIDFVEDFAEVGDYFDLPMASYSPGMRARVAFGMSMAFDFDYYLIDEVMAVGDPIFRRKAGEMFRERLQGAGVILVSHNHNDIRELCSSLVLMHEGEAHVYHDVEQGLAAFQEIVQEATR